MTARYASGVPYCKRKRFDLMLRTAACLHECAGVRRHITMRNAFPRATRRLTLCYLKFELPNAKCMWDPNAFSASI